MYMHLYFFYTWHGIPTVKAHYPLTNSVAAAYSLVHSIYLLFYWSLSKIYGRKLNRSAWYTVHLCIMQVCTFYGRWNGNDYDEDVWCVQSTLQYERWECNGKMERDVVSS